MENKMRFITHKKYAEIVETAERIHLDLPEFHKLIAESKWNAKLHFDKYGDFILVKPNHRLNAGREIIMVQTTRVEGFHMSNYALCQGFSYNNGNIGSQRQDVIELLEKAEAEKKMSAEAPKGL